MRRTLVVPLVLLGSMVTCAQTSAQVIQEDDPNIAPAPGEERTVIEEGGCRVIIVRRFDEAGETIRRIRRCNNDSGEE